MSYESLATVVFWLIHRSLNILNWEHSNKMKNERSLYCLHKYTDYTWKSSLKPNQKCKTYTEKSCERVRRSHGKCWKRERGRKPSLGGNDAKDVGGWRGLLYVSMVVCGERIGAVGIKNYFTWVICYYKLLPESL